MRLFTHRKIDLVRDGQPKKREIQKHVKMMSRNDLHISPIKLRIATTQTVKEKSERSKIEQRMSQLRCLI